MTTTIRRVTAADVAKEAGVSRATVGFVLNGTKGQTISASTTKKVKAAAAKLGYTPHSRAQALRSGRSKIVLMVLPDWPLEHQMRVHLEQVARVLDDAGLTLITHTPLSPDKRSGPPVWAAVDPLAVVGLEPFSQSDIESMRRLNITTIVPSPAQPPADKQVFDASIAHTLQVRHLLARGHTHLAFAAPSDPRLNDLAQTRLNHVIAACKAAGLPQPSVLFPARTSGDRAEYDVRRAVGSGISAAIAYNDDVAADLIGSAAAQNVAVPGEMAVIGHDDSPLASRFIPSISSVRIDHRRLGEYVGHLVLHSAGLRQDVPLPQVKIDVVARESTAES